MTTKKNATLLYVVMAGNKLWEGTGKESHIRVFKTAMAARVSLGHGKKFGATHIAVIDVEKLIEVLT